MTIRFFTLCICLFFISGRLTAQEINLKKNQEFIIETENTVTMPGAATHSCKEFAFKVIENDRSGNYILEAELIAASQKSESDGRVFVFVSDSLKNIYFNKSDRKNVGWGKSVKVSVIVRGDSSNKNNT